MSIKVCTSENLLSTVDGMDMRHTWFPRKVAEAFLESVKDGEISRSPDPVTMISGDLTWYNANPAAQHVLVQVIRAPRDLVAQSPATVVIHDAWTHRVGVNPSADYPSVMQDSFGGKAQIDRPETEADKLAYGRLFLDGDSSQVWVDVGVVGPRESLHFRYLCAVQTPGTWRTPTEFEPRWEARAYWTRLAAIARPALGLAAA